MRETTMKQRMIIIALVLGLAGVLAGCSADSPTAPKPSPTPASFSITLEASSSSAEVGSAILLTARASQGGQNVPDNTSVTFNLYQCPGVGVATDPSFENGMCQITRTTTGGAATAQLISRTAGTFGVTAIMRGQSQSRNLLFFDPVNPRSLAVYGVDPNRGRPTGGEQVTIIGRGFAKPVTVDFVGEGGTRHAAVVNVNNTGTEIVVITPNTDFLEATQVDIVVTAAAGTSSSVTDTLRKGFLFEKPTNAPLIYQIIPPQGIVTGGEQVIVKGANFVPTVTVRFGEEDVQVMSVSADNTTLTLVTPSHSGAAGTVDVTITNGQKLSGTRVSGWTWVPVKTEPGVPVIYQINPNRGSPRGGQEVTITGLDLCNTYSALTGKCAEAPSVAFAIPGGGERAAAVISFADNGKTIKVLTPEASPNPVLTDLLADVRVTNAKGATTLSGGYTYVGEAGEPEILGITPNKGSARGGDTVVIVGRYFLDPVQVRFSMGGLAVVKAVSADKTQITITVPAASIQPIEQDSFSDVTVTTQTGTGRDKSATLPNGYLFLADEPTPQLFSLSPNSGPVDGGTRVTITGQGFQYPVQVFFGDHQGQVLSNNFYQVVCVSPSITPTQPGTPTTVDVTVLNAATGKRSGALSFRYGEAMFLSGVDPNHGPADEDTHVTIYGQGFVGPVEVVTVAGGERLQASVDHVSGTEILATIKPLPASRRSCGIVTAGIEVTNLNSNLRASGLSFYYESPTPLITSVEITGGAKTVVDNTVPQYNPGSPYSACSTNANWSAYKVTVRGSNFQKTLTGDSAMTIVIPGVTAELPTTFVSANEIFFTLPDLTGAGLQEVSCITNTGVCGLQYVQTPISLTVKNVRSSCEDTLNGAIVILPCDPRCREVPQITAIELFPSGQVATVGQPLTMRVTLSSAPLAGTNVPVSLSYVGFTGSPSEVMVPGGLGSATWNFTVTPGTAAIGTGLASIIGQTGTNTCARLAQTELFSVRPPVTITTESPLPPGVVGLAYGPIQLTVTGGNGTYPGTWLPAHPLPWLTLSPGGELFGTPSNYGPFAFTVEVSDSDGRKAQTELSLTITPPPIVLGTCPSVDGKVGVSYGPVTVSASGGFGSKTWSVVGALPAGLGLTTIPPGNGAVISGLPTAAGTNTFILRVQDSTIPTPQVETMGCSITINP